MLRCDAPAARGRRSSLRGLGQALALLAVVGGPLVALAATTDLSSVPLPTFTIGSTVDIKPNIMMVLDDSGSMDWDYLPDWANDRPSNYSSLPTYLYRNASYNGVAYNPAVRYQPPVTFNNAGAKDTTRYPSMTGVSTATGGDLTATTANPNWHAVMYDGFNVQTNSNGARPATDLEDAAYFFTMVAGEYCDSPALTNCTTASAPTGNYQYAAPLRWCSNTTLTTCRGLWSSTFNKPRTPAPRMATISFSNLGNATVSSVKIDTFEIMSGSTGFSTTDGPTLASRVASAINNCSFGLTGNCAVVGYRASASGSTVRIYAPGTTGNSPVVTKSNVTTSITAFARQPVPLPDWANSTSVSSAAVPGENLMTVIARPTTTTYPYPGSAVKAGGRTDCAGTVCTYKEEMTNYANWWVYYRTRMQMMKTSTSRAFSSLDSDANITAGITRYRVGYLSINNNTGSDFVNINDFDATQKVTWFSKLFAARPNNSTPLRTALSTAGRLYGGKLNGSVLNGTRVTEPLQFSCQKNYTILSTDGFWNGGGGVKLDGTTDMDNQDGPLPPPYKDGSTSQNQARTSKLQQRISTQTAELGTLQRQVSQLQTRNSTLQKRTSNNSGNTWTDWFDAGSCSADNSGSSRTQCRYLDGPWSNTGSCTAIARSTGNNWNRDVAVDCQTVVSSAYTNTTSCTPSDANSSGQSVQCQYTFATAAAVQNCAPAYVSGTFTSTTVYRNCTTTPGTLTDVATCTPSTTPDVNGQTKSCSYSAWSAWSNVTACTAIAQSTGPNYNVATARECQLTATGGTSNTLADVAAYYYLHDLRDATITGTDATGTCVGPIVPPATTPSDLCANNVVPTGRDTNTKQHMTTHTLGLGAQGQMVYSNYQNDLSGQRTYSPDYWTQSSGDFYDVANGNTASPSTGICPWMAAGSTCTWPTPAADSTANIDDLWHAAVNGHGTYFSAADPTGLADALNGVLSQIVNTPRPGTAAAAASSNPNITSSDNFVFSSSYRSVEWHGELIMQRFNADGSLTPQQWSAMQLLDCATTAWQPNHAYSVGQAFSQGGQCYAVDSAYSSGSTFDGGDTGVDGQNITQLPTAPYTRNIYTAGSSGLVPFTWANLTSSQQAMFSKPAIDFASATDGLSQFCTTGAACLTAATQASASGQALVNYLRGQRTNETTWFRTRTHVLGDIVSSEARYVKVPLFNYADPGYADYKTLQADRSPTVYVGANDGMLHAFDALTGQERWAFIPSAVLPDLYRLADMDYPNKHRYFVDGTPEVGDICPSAPGTACTAAQWRTIIVGGLNQGGKSFYALDITDPASPRLLWEFTNSNMGYSYSNPRITKLADGTWVVIVATGYNNADGIGRIIVLNASTGAVLNTISTGAGSTATPSGLAKLEGRAPTGFTNNTVEEIYGGDMLGNLWRFDVNNNIGAPGYDAQLLTTFRDPTGVAQPITAKPTVASVASKPLVIVGTGRYLGLNDLTDTSTYTMYAVKDKLDAVTLASPRTSGSNFVQQTLTNTTCPTDAPASICDQGQTVRTGSSNAVDWSVKNGWYIDFILGGERAVTDSTLALGTLVFTTIKPQATTASAVLGCTGEDTLVNAKSFLYYLDFLTGSAVQGTKNVAGEELCTCVATRPSVVKTQNGNLEAIIRMSGGGASTGTDMGVTNRQDVPYLPAGGASRRISWRELNGE